MTFLTRPKDTSSRRCARLLDGYGDSFLLRPAPGAGSLYRFLDSLFHSGSATRPSKSDPPKIAARLDPAAARPAGQGDAERLPEPTAFSCPPPSLLAGPRPRARSR